MNKKLQNKEKELRIRKENTNISIPKKKLKKMVLQTLSNKPDDKGAEVPIRKVAKLEKLKHESEAHFLNRVEKEVETVIHRSQYENQFDCKLETENDKVVVTKEKKMSERKRRYLLAFNSKNFFSILFIYF